MSNLVGHDSDGNPYFITQTMEDMPMKEVIDSISNHGVWKFEKMSVDQFETASTQYVEAFFDMLNMGDGLIAIQDSIENTSNEEGTRCLTFHYTIRWEMHAGKELIEYTIDEWTLGFKKGVISFYPQEPVDNGKFGTLKFRFFYYPKTGEAA